MKTAKERPNPTPIRQWYRGAIQPGNTTPLELLMVQSTRFCNINCSYCYLPFRDQKTRFDTSLIEPMVQRLLEANLLGSELTVLWHAGEPFSLPAKYYEEAFSEFKRVCPPETKLVHNVQTNAMLLSDAYVELIKKWNVSVGVSVDGPAWLNDLNRVTRAGHGSHEKTMAGVQRLRSAGIPFTCIAVLTAESLEHPDELYDFFKSSGCLYLGLNIDEEESIHTNSSMVGNNKVALYKTFLKRVHRRMKEDSKPLRIREFEGSAGMLSGWFLQQPAVCTENNPLSIVSVDAEGYFYTFSPEFVDIKSERYGDFKLGHVTDIDFTNLYKNKTFAALNRDIQQGVYNCRTSCSYFEVCGGGVPSNKFFELGDLTGTETNFCRFTRKAKVDAVHELISEAHELRLTSDRSVN